MDNCSECGGLNDMCGVFLKKINLCDECAGDVIEILLDERPKEYKKKLLEWIEQNNDEYDDNNIYYAKEGVVDVKKLKEKIEELI